MYSILWISFFYDCWPPFLPRTSMRVDICQRRCLELRFFFYLWPKKKKKSFPSPIESYYFIHPFLLSSHTKLEFRHVISLSSSSVTTIKSQNLIHTHFLIPSIVFVISLVLKLSSWIETYLKTEGCQLKLAPLQIAKNPG